MRITVKAKASSKANQLELRDNIYHVWVKAVARDGKANAAIIKLLATHFGIPQNRIELVRGSKQQHKIFEIKTAP